MFSVSNTNEDRARQFLNKHKWPVGFQSLLVSQITEKIPLRFFICDDSGSMFEDDGQHLVSNGTMHKALKCTRWKELGDSLRFHVELAKESNAPSEFRLLNALAPKMVGDPNADPDFSNVRALNKIFDGGPSGGTPLCRHINDVVNFLRHHEQDFRQAGQVASLVICTDGVSSDGDVTVAMRPLKQLPVMIVVRLCTDSDDVVSYWDRVERDLEMDLDIIDDFFGEGKGVHDYNPWINYGEPLQRLREFGVKVKELDMIDEKTLTVQQMQVYMSYLFNCRQQDVPDPQFDWSTFEAWVTNQLKSLPLTYNPNSLSTGVEPWIDVGKLRSTYNPNAGCCSIN